MKNSIEELYEGVIWGIKIIMKVGKKEITKDLQMLSNKEVYSLVSEIIRLHGDYQLIRAINDYEPEERE